MRWLGFGSAWVARAADAVRAVFFIGSEVLDYHVVVIVFPYQSFVSGADEVQISVVRGERWG